MDIYLLCGLELSFASLYIVDVDSTMFGLILEGMVEILIAQSRKAKIHLFIYTLIIQAPTVA
jgi:hypothetical protein